MSERTKRLKAYLNTTEGKDLMAHLMERCSFLDTASSTTGSSTGMEFREGQRDIFLHLFKIANFPSTKLVDFVQLNDDDLRKRKVATEEGNTTPYQRMLQGV